MLNLIWYEKYRARKLAQLVLPKENRKRFKHYIRKGQIPHLLFYGPAGSGKTTLATILIRECASAALTLNASSSDRGIGTIKTKVKQFAASQRRSEDRLNIVLLDEADGLTPDAQLALKNTIEHYYKNCRFIFTTNEIDRIIEPITSRCTLYKFDSPPEDYIIEFLVNILIEEAIEHKRKDVGLIVRSFYPDIRTMINNLQVGSVGGRLVLANAMTSIHNEKELLKLLHKGKIGRIRAIVAGTKDFMWLYKLLFNDYLEMVEDDFKSDVATTIAEYLWRDRTVADREINVVACLCEILNVRDKDVYF